MKVLGLVTSAMLLCGAAAVAQQRFTDTFDVNLRELASEGENPYFILKPGYQLVLEGREGGKAVQLTITVLPETLNISGVTTRIVEERETSGGALVEVSRNFFAIDPRTKDVYYFGEEVDIYEHGSVASHDGAWRHGTNGARFGLIMPGTATVGRRYYQEYAPGIALDRAEVVSVSTRSTTPAGTFDKCLRTRETTPLERGTEFKVYAPGIGLAEEGTLKLVSHGYIDQRR